MENIKDKTFLYCNNFNDCYTFVAVTDPEVTGNNISAAVGNPAVLTCNVSDNPEGTIVDYQWKRAGMNLANSTIHQVLSVSFPDAGVYTCEVTVRALESSPLIISAASSVNITLTVTSK